MSVFRILDLYCGEGGASMGYFRACRAAGVDCEIVGVDLRPMSHYPFKFVQDDVMCLDYDFLDSFDFIHASPPCKPHTRLYRFARYDMDVTMLPRTVTVLEAINKPYVVENVPQAPLRADVCLDGSMFGLRVLRQRIFRCNFEIACYPVPSMPELEIVTVAGNAADKRTMQRAMMCSWMSASGVREAIPPLYSFWIMSEYLKTRRL